MASAGVAPAPASGVRDVNASSVAAVDRLPDEMHDMKIRDDKVKMNHKCLCYLLLYEFFFASPF